MLTKTKVALEYVQSESYKGRYCFALPSDDEGWNASITFLDMQEAAYEDMGRPTQITVTVEPGDKLNEED